MTVKRPKKAASWIKIPATLLASARQRPSRVQEDASPVLTVTREDVFRPAQPPRGVVPESAGKLAFDEALSCGGGWGGSAWAWQAYAVGSVLSEGMVWLGYSLLAMLAQRGEYRRISERIATEMTRKWIDFESTGDEKDEAQKERHERIEKIKAEFERLKVREAFREAAQQDGLFGRSHLYMDTGVTDDRDELKTPLGDGTEKSSGPKVSKTKPLLAVRPVEAVWTYPSRYDSIDPLAGGWYRPTGWYVMGKEVHHTRLLTFVGREVPDVLKPAYSFGGLSLTQMAKPYVDNWLKTRQSVNDIISAFSVFVLGTDLMTQLQQGGDGLMDRLDLFSLTRDNRGVMAIDKDKETFQNVSAPLGTLDHLQAQALEHICSITGIPLVVFTGITPSGLNASSDGEIRVFYDWINSYQELLFRENLTRIFRFVQLSLFEVVDDSITIKFVPLYSLNEKEQADLRKVEADTDAAYIEAGVVSPEESRRRLAGQPGSPYASLDVEDVPEPPVEEGTGEPFHARETVAEPDGEET